MATIPAYTINGFTRPELILDGFGNIVLNDTAAAFAQAYGLKALYLGCPPSTPYPPVLPSLLLPTDTNGAPNTVAEGAAANTTVGITAHSTSILGFPVTYSLTADSSAGGFQINATTGVVSVLNPSKIDFESSPGHSYSITVRANDGILTTFQTFTIGVSDVAPSTPTDANAAANTVAEGAANGTAVGVTVSATDVNGGTVTYSLTDNANGAFAINATTGVITVADSTKIDFETAVGHAYTVTARASDGTAFSNTQSFTIGVSDVPVSTPIDSNAATNSVAEGAAAGTAVGITASAVDPNGPASTYALIGDTSGGGFTINATTGVVTVADPAKIDYETAAGHAYGITVQATSGASSTTQTFSIAVTDVAPSTPVDSNAAANTVVEGAANGSAVGITASSTDINGPAVTYSLTGDTSGGGFTINSATGVVTVADASKVDYETAAGHAYTVTAQASDGTLTSSHTFTIAVSDVAPSTPVDSNATANTVVEGAANGSTVGITASSTDINGPAVTYSLTGDTSGGGFTINAATGVVTVADASKIDYETAAGHAYTVTAQASDGTLSSSQTFTIAVSDVAPSTPVDSDAAANTVIEGAANGSTVGITAASTDINGPAVTWSLIGDTSGGGFTIDSSTGVVTVADSTKIDYESAAGHAYTVTAQASDGTLTSSQTFSVIAVTDTAPTTPVDSDAAANTVAEGAANGSTVGVTASSTDVNGPAVTYSLTGDTSGGGFTINAATGVVTVADASKINFESSGGSYTVTAQASDGFLSSSQTFTIAVTDVAPSTPVDSNAAANTVAEGAANGSTVGVTASSTDVNGPAVTYSLVGDTSGGGFTINSATGVVTVADASKIDYETAAGHAYTVTAQASDGTLSSSQTFTIAVSDIAPSTPVDSDAAANTVVEGAANGSTVGITASSTDVNGPAVTWALVGDTSGGGFTINAATGVVTVADATKIDFESSGGSYTVVAQSSDGTLASSQAFVINVSDIAPSTPVDSNAAANTVAEGAANGSTIGVTASSTDVNGPAVTYSLTGDTSGGGFTINAATGVVTVADATKIDYETAAGHAYTVTAQASDGTLSSSQTFTIAVSDVAPSTPVDSDAAANTVAEGLANGSTVGVTASSTDVNGPAVTYSLVGDTSGGGFTINAATGVVTVADASKIDYETAAGHAYTVTAQASDGTLSSSQTFTIAVSDVAPSSPVDSDAAANTVVEGAANGSTVGVTASSTDVNGPAVTWALVGDTSGGGFTINAATGVVTVADATKIDFESSGGSYTVTAQASDGTLTSSQAFVIAVTDVAPSTPVDSNAAANTVAEGAANGSTVGVTASSTDVNGPAVTYSLTGDTSGGGFTINAATGVVTVADATKIDYETAAGHAYTVTAQASDGTLSSSQTFTIAVSDLAPSTPVDSDAAANTVAEGLANGSTVGVTASSTDVNGPAVTYSLTGDTSGGGFTINAATGVVTVADASKIDYETAAGHAYTVTAQASDGTLSTSQTFTIAVSDIAPSTPVDSDAAANTIAEGLANGSTVGVTATSTDVNGPAVTYSLVGDTSGGGFTINATTGVVTIADATKIDFESSGGSYTVTAQASDGTLASSQAFVIAVTDVAPSTPVDSDGTANSVVQGAAVGTYSGVTASSTDVNGPAVTYTLVGDTSGGGFTINSATGAVTVADSSKVIFTTNPTTYDVTVDSSDGTLHSQQTFTINIDPNAPPAIDSDGSGATAALSAAENQTAVTTVHATDSDGPSPVSYSIVGGDDQAKFAIDSSTGVLTFITAPNFENPTDTSTAGNNTYIVTVQASDGAAIDQQTITVTVTDVNDAPVITSNGGLATASINVNENTTAVTTVTSTDQDNPAQTLTYSLAGGADQAKFSIDPSTGVLTFITAPNFEAPTDAGTDNGYDVIVRVTDNGTPNLHDDQAITVHVQDVNEAPDTAAVTVTGNEDPTGPAYIPITISGTDVDSGDTISSFHITGIPNVATQGILYSDIGLTTQVTNNSDVTATGNAATLYFVPNANFNTHAGAVTFNAAATDNHGLTDATPATETINVTAVNDAPINNGVPANFTVQSGFNHVITGLSISDLDANEVGTPTDITTTFTAGAGAVVIGNGGSGGTAGIAGGATITTNGTGTVTLTGSVAQINTTLSGNNVAYNAADSAGNGSSSTTLQMATNDHGHNGTGGAITDTDTISVGVIPQVWFINNAAGAVTDATAPLGSQANPFASVHDFNASSGPGANDYIYVKEGTYDGEGINLKAGQTLLGDDQALSFANPLGGSPIVIEDGTGARPTINVTAAGDQGIALASGNTVAGIVVTTNAATQVGIDDSGASVGNLNISDTDVTGGGQAINLTHGGTGGSVALGTVSSTGGTTGIALGGALVTNFSATTGTLSGHSGSEFSSNGGSGTVSYGGAIGDGTGTTSVSIVNRTGGTVTLSGNITDSNDVNGGIGISGNANTTINLTGAAKTLDTGIGDGVSITSNTGSTVNFTNGGLSIHTTNGTGFSDTVSGTVSVTGTGNTISTTGTGTALNLSHVTVGAGGVTFDSASTTNAANGIVIDTVSGGAINVNGGTIAGATSNGVNINAAQSNISIASSIASTSAGHSVQVTGSGTGGGNTISFSGAITDPGLGVNLNNNDQNGGVATVNFSGGMNIDATTHTGFNATNGGTVNVTNGANNSITTTTGTALNIDSTTIGSSEVTFHDISSNGAASGIILNSTGTTGGLNVTGSGAASRDGSGGTITGSTGNGVSLTNTSQVSLTHMNINNSGTNGIFGSQVNGFVSDWNSLTGNGNAVNEGGIRFGTGLDGDPTGLTGGAIGSATETRIDHTVISTSFEHGLVVENTSGTLTQLNLTGTTIQNDGNGSGFLIETRGPAGSTAAATVQIEGSSFLNNPGAGVQGNALRNTTLTMNILGNTAAGTNTFTGHDTILLSNGDTGHLIADVRNNTISGNGNGIFVGNAVSATSGATLSAKIVGNSVTTNAGGANHSISAFMSGGTSHLLIDSNTVVNNGQANGINIGTPDDPSGPNFTAIVTNNTVTGGATAANGISLSADVSGPGATAVFKVEGNTVNWSASNINNLDGIFLNQFGTSTVKLERGISGSSDAATVLAANNPNVHGSAGGPAIDAEGTIAIVANGTITLPLLAALGGVAAATPAQAASTGDYHLTQAELDSVVAAAIAQWAAAGASASQLAALHDTTFSVADLSDNTVGAESSPSHITIDVDAAGHGWFVDPTPSNNSEFTHAANAAGTDLFTDPSNAAAGHLDLLTTVSHEMGHVLGLPDLTSTQDINDLMYIDLVDGERRLPDAGDVPVTNTTPLTPNVALGPVVTPTMVVGTAGNDVIDAGHGGKTLVGGAGADNFVFANVDLHAATPLPLTHVADYSFAQGDTLDFSALTSQFHYSNIADASLLRVVEDASGTFATVQVNTSAAMRGGATWTTVAQLDGAHAGDDVGVLVDSNAAVHVAHLHAGLLV